MSVPPPENGEERIDSGSPRKCELSAPRAERRTIRGCPHEKRAFERIRRAHSPPADAGADESDGDKSGARGDGRGQALRRDRDCRPIM